MIQHLGDGAILDYMIAEKKVSARYVPKRTACLGTESESAEWEHMTSPERQVGAMDLSDIQLAKRNPRAKAAE